MKALLVSVLVALIGIPIGATPQRARQPMPPNMHAQMPPEKAKALFDDARVRAFVSFVTSKEMNAECSLPDPAKTDAKVTPPPAGAPPEFASTAYQVDIPCKGKNGLASISMSAEFVTLQSAPMNLTLSLNYRQ